MRAGRLERRVGALAGEPVLGGTFRVSRESGGPWPAGGCAVTAVAGSGRAGSSPAAFGLISSCSVGTASRSLVCFTLRAVQILRFSCSLGVTYSRCLLKVS